MIAWRIIKRKWKKQALSGEGARLAGGRWNSVGYPVVYLSENLPLASLEVIAINEGLSFGKDYVYLKVDIPDSSIQDVLSRELSRNWYDSIWDFTETRKIGDRWFLKGETVALRVPSIITPVERNLILNTTHPDFTKIKIGTPKPFYLHTGASMGNL
jgi:RES domain-containing protein